MNQDFFGNLRNSRLAGEVRPDRGFEFFLLIRLPCAPVSCVSGVRFDGYFRSQRLRGWKDFWNPPPVVEPEADDDV